MIAAAMVPIPTIRRTFTDADVFRHAFEVCDGTSLFVSEAYASIDWGETSANALRAFSRHVHGGLFNLEVGNGGPEYASGAFRARFHFYKPTDLLISTTQQGEYFPFKAREVATEAKLFLRTEPALLDRFIAELPALDRPDGGVASLECVPLRFS